MLCCFTTVHADSSRETLQAWYHPYFFYDGQTSNIVDIRNEKKEIIIPREKQELEEKHNHILNETTARIEAYQQNYLSRLKEEEDILVNSHFGDYTKRKTEEINESISQDVVDFLADLLVDE